MNHASIEELQLIRESMMIPLLIDLAVKNRDEIERTEYTFRPLYVAACDRVLSLLHNRMREVKRLLREAKIRLWEGEHNEFVIYTNYVCRGYEDRFGITREHLKAELRKMLTEYMKNVL